jgi:glycolate oxidase FAD binding subunit
MEPMVAVQPGTAAEVAEVLQFAAAERLAVIPMGGRSKLGIGMPPAQYDLALDMTRMNGVVAYDPRDLTLCVAAGARYADVVRLLAKERQMLPLGPPFAERSTIGGILAAGSDSPLRHAYGSARDFLLGVEFVTGSGVVSKSGGRVVKNVTGYDLHKLLVGSLGTLAVITQANFRTFPLPQEQKMLLVSFAKSSSASGFCARLAESRLQPRIVEAVSPLAARLLAQKNRAVLPENLWTVVIGAGGPHAAVTRHERDTATMAHEAGATEFCAIEGEQEFALSEAICEFPRLVIEAYARAAIFRIATPPSAMDALIEQVAAAGRRHEAWVAILARASGIIYAAVSPPDGAGGQTVLAEICRNVMDAGIAAGARPMIEWCAPELKNELNIWPPTDDTLMLMQRVKRAFDPEGVLAPGRFLGGI